MAQKPQIPNGGWMQRVLIASLAVNLFLAGFLVAKAVSPGGTMPTGEPLTVNLSGLPQDIPPELRESLEENFQKHSREVGKIYGDLIEARVIARETLEREVLDAVALEEALANVRELQIRIQGPLHEALVEAAKDLDAEMRRELVIFGETFDRGIWQPRRVDGARWKVQFDNGEMVIDIEGITDPENGDEQPHEETPSR